MTDPRLAGILLSPSFTLEEMVRSDLALRKGIPNEPTEAAVAALTALCVFVLQPARDALGPIIVSSGFRSPDVNRLAGGSRGSQHMLGEAADIQPAMSSRRALFAWLFRRAPFDQLIWEFGDEDQPAWIHVSHAASGEQREQVYRAMSHGGRTLYRPVTGDELARLTRA